MKISVITVCLNSGEKLGVTLDSILRQDCQDVEVILKDGGSTDGSVEKWRQENASIPGIEKVRIFVEKDRGIYDAMNQAVSHASGDFLLFLNCGDRFADEGVLKRTLDYLEEEEKAGTDLDRLVLYGDTCGEKNDVVIASAPEITGFTCYRNIPCHQSCFYSAALCREKPYDLQYRIRADYDHFLWCYYRAGAKMRHMDFPVAVYEGGGFSEKRENRERDRQEHREITGKYMGRGELFRYRAVMACTLAPLRKAMAESRCFSGFYHWLKERVYKRKKWFLAALLFFLAELALLIWPVGWLKEDKENILLGEGSWYMESQGDSFSCSQEFKPEYSNLESIGIVVMGEEGLSGGDAVVVVSDSENEVLFRTKIPYEQVAIDTYTNVEVNLSLRPGGKSYFLSVYLEPDERGRVPVLEACSMEYFMPENIALRQEEELEGAQLLTRYSYKDGLSAGRILRALLLCAFTAFGIAFGIPEERRLRTAAGILLLVLGPYVLGSRLELLTIKTQFLLPYSMKWNLGLMYLLELIVLLCTQSIRFSICFCNLVLTLLYSANYFVFTFRGVPLRFNDLSAIETAVRVMDRYSLRPNHHMAMAWCIFLLIFVYGVQTGRCRKVKRGKKRVAGRIGCFALGIVLAAVSGYRFLYTDIFEKAGFLNIRGFDQNKSYHFDGYLVASFIDIQNSRVTEPQEYSVKRVEELLKEAAGNLEDDLKGAQKPHIILVMNESYADLRVLGNLEISKENMSFFYSLNENTVRGYVNVSVLGGGTSNSEFEVFTGCSMGFLPSAYYPYQQCVVKEMPSLISDLKKAGYTTYSMHPEIAENWNRNRIYRYFGFDNSIWLEDFSGAEKLHYGVTDMETYKKVIELFENRQEGESMFVFDLTVQNHGGYTQSDVNRSVGAVNVSSEEADIYLSLIQESDDALKELIHYFEKVEEPVIICMYGDHQPKLEDDFYENVYSSTPGIEEKDKTLNQYKTPFFIWANYDIEEREELNIGMSYLGALLLEVAEVPGAPFFSFLQQYMNQYPIVTVNGYEDEEGNFCNWSGEDTELMEYRMLQYNHLFDRNIVEWGF